MSPRARALNAKPGQPFLHGPTLYFRGIETGDSAHVTAWRPSTFPISSELLEEQLKDSVIRNALARSYRLVACRFSDHFPAGSAEYDANDGHSAWLSLYADPMLGSHAGEIRAEMLAVIVPWLLTERELLCVWVNVPSYDVDVIAAAEQAGMTRVGRFRESVFESGARHDLICFQGINERWLDRLGTPEPSIEGTVEREVKYPAGASGLLPGETPPENAFVVGQRVYLRPIEQADAEEMARLSARETERFHDQGRHVRSPISSWQAHRKLPESEPPDWIRFAIVDREREIIIGANGLADVDWVNRTAETETEIVRPEYRGAGYGTEAKHLLLEYAFERIGLHAVFAYAWAFNTRSCSALLKQGYRQVGRLAWTGVKDGNFVDDLAFDLLASEWRAARQH